MKRTIQWITVTAALVLAGLGLTVQGQTITSVGNGNWHNNDTWDGNAPGATDNVVIAAGHVVTVDEASTAYTVSNLTVNGTLTHRANTTTGAAHYRVDLTVLGDLAVAASGAIDVRGRGYAYGKGPAPGNTYNTYAAYHGGVGASPAASPYTTYGSVTNPTTLGSGGDGALATAYGGGAIVLRVDGATTVDGQLRADAADLTSDWRAGAAGGSVNLITDTISGSGLISANGNTNSYANSIGGGGGRVAVKLKTGTGFDDVKLFATGGSPTHTTVARRGAAGTVYRQTALQDDGEGDLIIDNNGIAVSVGIVTLISSNVTDAVAGDVIFSSTNAWLGVGPGAAMTMSGGFSSGQASASLLGVALFGGTLNTPAVLSCSNLTLRFAGPSTFSPATSLNILSNTIVIADAPHTLTGNLILKAGSLMTHTANNGVSDPHYWIDLTVGGNLTVEPNGVIDVKGKGYTLAKGPAPGLPTGGNAYAASHGGLGGGASASPYTTYGSITNPTTLGSGGCGWSAASGGGAVILRVSGSASHNGMIRADGADVGNDWRGGSAGGSVNLSADTLSGTGIISANGNTNYYSSSRGGGGGRVAVLLRSGADCGGVSIRAFGGVGGSGNGAPGPIYLQTAGQAGGAGTLMVNGGGNAPGSGCSTLISTNVTDHVTGSLIITNSGKFVIAPTVSFTISSNLYNFSQTISLGGTFVVGGAGTSRLGGNVATNRFYNLTSTNAGKRIEFESGKTFQLDNVLTLEGTDGNLLEVDATDAGMWKLIVPPALPHSVNYVDAAKSDASKGAPISAFNSFNRDDSNINWTFVVEGATNTWTGTDSTSWGSTANWSLGQPPAETDVVLITTDNSPPNWPVLNLDTVVRTLLIESGAEMALGGNNLTVETNLVVTGTLIANGSETLRLKGDADFTGGALTAASSTVVVDGSEAQHLALGGIVLNAIILRNHEALVSLSGVFSAAELTNEGGNLDFGDGFSIRDFVCRQTGVTMTFNGGSVFAMTNLTLSGSMTNRIVLASESPGTQWQLNVSGVSSVSSVEVSDSNADDGLTIRPIASVPGGAANNNNWVFDSGTWKVWTGTSADFMVSGNWNPSAMPGPGDSLLIETTTGMTAPLLTNELTIADLVIGGLDTATLTLRAPLTVTNRMAILSDGVLTHTANTTVGGVHYHLELTVGGDLEIASGGTISADAKGYQGSAGPAPGYENNHAAAHGGLGGHYDTAPSPYTTYGSVTNPITHGSGGAAGHNGGGAVILRVDGATIIDEGGRISANAPPQNTQWIYGHGAAGGSVNLRTGTLSGEGVISADGNTTTQTGGAAWGGGGGRVAVILSSGADTGSVSIRAQGGSLANIQNSRGAAGTVYVQTALQANGEGDLIIDNAGSATRAGVSALISTNVTDAVAGDVVVTGAGRLIVGANALLTIRGSITNAVGTTFSTETDSSVEFTGASAGTVWGDRTFHNLSIGDAGSKPLTFEAGKTQTVEGTLAMNKAILQSTSPGSAWLLTLNGVQSDILRVYVQDSNASGGQTIEAGSGSVDQGNNINWVFPARGTMFLMR